MLWTSGTSRDAALAEADLDREIDVLVVTLDERGPIERHELAALVGAAAWGPGRFRAALEEAVAEGAASHPSRRTYAPRRR
jgi:hypothetical protein